MRILSRSAGLFPALLLLFLTPSSLLGAPICHHTLSLEIQPGRNLLLVQDTIQIEPAQKGGLTLLLAEHTRITSILVNGAASEYFLRSGRLTIPPASPDHGISSVTIEYEAVFNDPIPQDPASFDNPGFGVTASITEKGTFLLPDSGWYPRLQDSRENLKIKVTAPAGIYAVTAGELTGHEDKEGKSISTWKVGDIGQGVALSAGRYIVRSRMAGKVPVYTYFSSETDSLSETYLKAAASQIEFYESLHGPYPFPKFAVVENFFPTGYGFPSYTLLGKTVLRLPFIPQTSLRHEVAHSWWGNGVLVDYDSGNWCEGLTTYVADYLSRETESAEEGKLYRQQILQEYAALAATGEDFPLSGFTSRTSPSTKAIGYGKAAFVFHMIRQRLGDEPFWRSLRQLFKERLLMKTSWEDIRDVFVRTGGWDSKEARLFFDRWISRGGAPVLKLQNVQAREGSDGWKVTGTLLQDPPYYVLDISLRLRSSEDKNADSRVRINGNALNYSVQSPKAPEQLAVDPDFDIFRLLYPEEIPAVVNSVKGSKKLVAVVSDSASPEDEKILAFLLASLNQANTAILHEKEANPGKNSTADYLFFGVPRSDELKSLLASSPQEVTISSEKFLVKGSAGSDCLFTVFSDTLRGGLTAIFLPAAGTSRSAVEATARKITHYGKYSYLAFSRGVIQAKGISNITHSPLIFDFGRNK
ncbi:MAG: M1 family metallopeptidase [Syntrophobacteraceae bacterium]